MNSHFPSSGLYAITDSTNWPGMSLVSAVEKSIDGGARAIQYREKKRTPDRYLAIELLKLCRSRQIPLIINDNIELAGEIGADGIHLGRHDRTLEEARTHLGDQAIIGISCYDSVVSATYAERAGADYVAYGCFYPSITKPNARPVTTDVLQQSCLRIPVVAIGGITPKNGLNLLESGANLLAVINGIFSRDDPASASAQYARLFETKHAI